MSVDPSLTISIDRSALTLDPLVCSGSRDASDFWITDYAEPAMQARVDYVPDSRWVHGSDPRAWSWQQTLIPFTVMANASTETEARAKVAELRAALTQGLTFEVTVSVSDADDEVWTCNPGSVSPVGSRTRTNMRFVNDEWAVSIPAYPVRS